MKKWEYKIVNLDLATPPQNGLNLNTYGNKGWKLCGTIPFWEALKVHFIFKRPKE